MSFLKLNFFLFSISKAKQSSKSEIRVSYIPMTCCHLLPENKDYALSVKQHFHNICKGLILLKRHLQGESQREQKDHTLSWCKSAQLSWENPNLFVILFLSSELEGQMIFLLFGWKGRDLSGDLRFLILGTIVKSIRMSRLRRIE